MAMNFNDVLKTKASEIERPPLTPVGTYTVVVKKVPSIETSQDGKWDFLSFNLGLLTAGDDVDVDDLKKFGGLNAGTVMSRRFIFDKEDDTKFKRTLYDVKRFLFEHLMVEGNDDTPLQEALNNSVGSQCLAFVKWRADKNDPEIQYSEIAKTAPLS